jgi:Mn2+/Fe2+ NRAMP family transporter
MSERSLPPLLKIIGPGILVAATGVGAGDLLTATMAGSEVGLSLMWAVAMGAVLKWVLNEGIARWQLATESTVLEGWVWRLGRWIQWVFLAYLLLFTLVVGGALVSACGVAGSGFLMVGNVSQSRIFWGVLHSLAGYLLVTYGSFALFEKLMSACIGIMFVTVVATVFLMSPDWPAVAAGFVPSIPPQGTSWLIAVLGGVGGTVTLLSYGYWIREEGRRGLDGVRICRIDLAVGYLMTAVFGFAVIIIGSQIEITGQGSALALQLADQLALTLGDWARPFFLLGFWGAVFSSLLGVWQSIPYMFADFMDLRAGSQPGVERNINLGKSRAYRVYLVIIATVSIVFLWTPVRQIQLTYGVIGALFMPLLALTLLIMNNRRRWVGAEFRTGWLMNAILAGGLLFFVYIGVLQILGLSPASG